MIPGEPTSAREIVLFSVGELGSGAHQAHLGALRTRLAQASPEATVHEVAHVSPRAWLTSEGRADLERARASASASLSGDFIVTPHEPRHWSLRWSAFALRHSVERIRVAPRPILHCRGSLAANVALLARRGGLECSIVHDVRGDRFAEVAPLGGEASPDTVLAREAAACTGADANLCVSRPLAELLRQRHGVEAEIFACAADTERFRPDEEGRAELRAQLGAGERFVLGYVGSAAGWQQPEATIALLSRIRSLRPDALLLVLTPDLDTWQRALEAQGLSVDRPGRERPGSTALLRRVPHDDVPRWLAAVDATALLRERDAINRVASPIKFGESLACGVPVLITEGIGDASALVRERGLGVVFDDLRLTGDRDQESLGRFLDRTRDDRSGLAAACRAAAIERWSWSEQMPRRLALYDRLGRQEP